MGKDDADTELQTARQTISRFHREILDRDIDWMTVQDFGGDIQKCEGASHQFNHTSVAQLRHDSSSCDRGSSEREHSVALTSKSQLEGRSKQGPKTPGKKKKKIPPPRPSGIISMDIPDDNIICDSLRGKPGEPEETVFNRTEDVAEHNSDTKITNERKQHVITRDQKDTLVVTKHGIKRNLTLTKQKFDGYLEQNELTSDNTMEPMMVGEAKSADDSEDVKVLEQLVERHPEKYIKCRFEQKGKDGVVNPLEKKLSVRIPNSKAWGRAFDGDTVVVELDENVPEGQTDFRYGKVVGIVERAENPLFMRIICRLNKRKDFLMTPLSSNRRSMQIKADGFLKKTADGSVCIPLYDHKENENDPEFPFVIRDTVKVPLRLRRNQLFYTRFVGWNAKSNYLNALLRH
ncbi:uncharacterized protein [Ptychodera flava]|uniref:uncharacterized protein n=1 Tax=Ptychodera flava TaxID=63121 RepID=UPI003969F355